MTNLSFHPSKPEDFDYFYDLRRRTMEGHFARAGKIWDDSELILHRQNFNPATLRMIHIDGKRVGFVNVTVTEHEIEFDQFCIEPFLQNQGIGKRVIETVQNEAAQLGSGLIL